MLYVINLLLIFQYVCSVFTILTFSVQNIWMSILAVQSLYTHITHIPTEQFYLIRIKHL